MALKFGTNTIATSGNYAKFGTTNLNTVKFTSSNTVWSKATGYTVTFSKSPSNLGSWSKSSITGVASGTSISLSGMKVTVGSQSSTFTKPSNTVWKSYSSSISNASGTVTANRTVTATTTTTNLYSTWQDAPVSIDGTYITSESISFHPTTIAKVYYDVYYFEPYNSEYLGLDYSGNMEISLNETITGILIPASVNMNDAEQYYMEMKLNSNGLEFEATYMQQAGSIITVFEVNKIEYV